MRKNKGGANLRGDATDIEQYSAGKYNLGYLDEGEWMEYTVDVQQADTFAVFASTASMTSGGSFEIYIDSVLSLTTGTILSTGGWTSFTEKKVGELELTAGEHLVRVKIKTKEFNLDYLRFDQNLSSAAKFIFKPTVRLYPNPAQDMLYLETENSTSKQIVITDLSGAVQTRLASSLELLSINVSFLTPGIYTCTVIENGLITSKQFIKN